MDFTAVAAVSSTDPDILVSCSTQPQDVVYTLNKIRRHPGTCQAEIEN